MVKAPNATRPDAHFVGVLRLPSRGGNTLNANELEKEAERIFDEFDSVKGKSTFLMIKKTLRAVHAKGFDEAKEKVIAHLHQEGEWVDDEIRALKSGDGK